MYLGALTLDVLLGDIRSLKQKRSAVASIIAEVRRRHPGVAVVAATAAHAVEVLESCERLVAARPDIELLSARFRLVTEEEEEE